MIPVLKCTVRLWARCVALALISAACVGIAGAQARALTVLELKGIYASSDETLGWGELQIPEFVAAHYGPRARAALVAILAEPPTRENYWFQRLALATAEYGHAEVPVPILLEFAGGRRGAEAIGGLRQGALYALANRPDTSLASFWRRLYRDERSASYRQAAPAGLACALGTVALPELAVMAQDSDARVARVAAFYLRELGDNGEGALACGGRVTRARAPAFPEELRPHLRERGRAVLERLP
jgi:hypothetical protein